MEFEWHDRKAQANRKKHGIDFEDAITIFEGRTLETRSDREGEERYKAIGLLEGFEIAVIYTPRGSSRRIISARRAQKNERDAYYQAHPGG
jgi:uncharacterized DUF497 family protein